ncbi:cytochrome c556 [Variovorax beijingensis]|jgi:Cytochrome c556|uniref:Cytochrome c556 n=2 Tax=Variovorax TaxID=34072 RepID=A0AAE3XZJ0_VARPD|nr:MULTISPECIES: cytochrome c [Variovorax]MBD9668553.1 cytochrome c [Variovorax sp. VRV01]MDP9966595.1 cytochrome c556 [Variovorax paradoxus]MDR6426622.1 cytochrome c556 [Variovorax paradoxus]MDR6450552.1 cytochrome c556 [Variovorax paradoxus]TWD90987.1 cytochrome c556 [Variovorax beijingensis]
MIRLASFALAAACAAISLPAAAQFAKPEDAIKYRQSALFVMGQHFSRVGAMANGRIPYDAAAASANAEIVAEMAKLPWTAFGAGTEGGKGKPEVWKEAAKFKEHQDKMVAETGKLVIAAKAGTIEALKAQFSATAASCKACHDSFRNQ